MFTLLKQSPLGRRGVLRTAHGDIQTPFFLPVATAGAMKGISLPELLELQSQVLLCNTYHLHIAPGEDIVEAAGGLHNFLQWPKPILTDSGGFQVFSLKSIRSITDAGVQFQNHRNGSPLFIGPKESTTIQHKLGADIIMCFDECPPSTAPRADQMKAVDRTLRWAEECKSVHEKLKAERSAARTPKTPRMPKTPKNSDSLESLESSESSASPLLFGIVQGGLERDLREKCANELIAIGFDGYAVGGLAVGETESEMLSVLDVVCPLLPENQARYLMGVGEIHQLREAAKRGIDMADCVSPMREARHGNVWLSNGEKLRINRSEYKTDHSPIDQDSPTHFGRDNLKSYLHHLLRLGERYGETIACMQNMGVMLDSMRKLREQIEKTDAL
ncbi:MAG TPA: tRNA guanosine(34) transglycosylase Tgt [Candidatus Peribacteria bacterium]|nr:tRNA guanosine(34) transglycosylase Tgt [Candidatus Peribacteria bacterium]